MTVMPMSRATEAAQHFPVTSPKVRTTAAPVRIVRVTGEADPNILARIVQPMVKLDLMPQYLNVLSEDDGVMLADIAFAAADSQNIRRFENSLRAVIGITSVEVI